MIYFIGSGQVKLLIHSSEGKETHGLSRTDFVDDFLDYGRLKLIK